MDDQILNRGEDHEIFQQEKRRAANRTAEKKTPDHVPDPPGEGARTGTEKHMVRKQTQPASDPSQIWILAPLLFSGH